MNRFFSLLAATVLCGTTALGQYTNVLDGGSNQYVTTVWDASLLDILVGSTTSSNSMFVDGGGSISNSSSAVIGQAGTANRNGVQLDGTGVYWLNSGDLTVGDAGSFNVLNILGGSVVSNANGFVGAQAGATNNAVLVAEAGSSWVSSGTLQIGAAGNSSNTVDVWSAGKVTAEKLVIFDGNAFNLNNGGTLQINGDFNRAGQTNLNWNAGGTLAIGGDLTGLDHLDGTNRILQIRDSGTWSGAGDRIIGQTGSVNLLQISDGGQVNNANGYIGATSNAIGNVVSVSGSNSVWNNTGELVVGLEGGGNSLNVFGGATVTSADAFVGKTADSSINIVNVYDDSSVWKVGVLHVGAESNSANKVNVESGGTVYADGLAIAAGNEFNLDSGGTLAMSGGFDASSNGINWKSGGTLSVGGVFSGMESDSKGDILSGGKRLVLDGGSFSSTTNLIVGHKSSDNHLAITNKATADNADGYIGWGGFSANNSVLVSGAGSAWTNSGNLFVGVYGSETNNLENTGNGNSLTVTNKGWVLVGTGAAGLTAGRDGGIAVGSGGGVGVGKKGAVLTDGLYIDPAGTFDLYGSLTVKNAFDAGQTGFNWKDGGGLTVENVLTFNADLSGENRTLTLAGTSGVWNRGDLKVDGNNNTLNILDGAIASSTDGYIGSGSNDWKNAAVVGGAGSQWNNTGNLFVGYLGSQNNLSITNGGRVMNVDGYLGYDAVSGKNTGLISGTNSLWKNSGSLYVGFQGSENSLEINDAGAVESVNGVVGSAAGADRNKVTVDGGSWMNSGNLLVGGTGSDNELKVLGGGFVSSVNSFVGSIAGTNNSVIVRGTGSAWTNSALLAIGSASGSGNSVLVGNSGGGGIIYTDQLKVFDGNKLTIGNAGTLAIGGDFNVEEQSNVVWQSTGHLAVHGDLTGMDIVNDRAVGDAVYLGEQKDLTIDGGTWFNGTNSLILGWGNRDVSDLTIINGGTVENENAYIGWGSLSDKNTVLVGDGSTWRNTGGNLYVGLWPTTRSNLWSSGNDNSVTVQSNGWVYVGEAAAPGGAAGGMVVASTNGATLLVGSGRSAVNVAQTLYVGTDASTTGRVEVSKGGLVSVGDLDIGINSAFDLKGSLTTAGNLDVEQVGFSWHDDSSITIGGRLEGLSTFSGTNRTVTLSGSGASAGTAVQDFTVKGSGNTFNVMDGARFDSFSTFIGSAKEDAENLVAVGAGSVFRVENDLWVGSGGASGNVFDVQENGRAEVGGNLMVDPGNLLNLGSTGVVTVAGSMTVSNATVSGSGGRVEFGTGANTLSILGSESSVSTGILFDGGAGDDMVDIRNNSLTVSGSLTNRFANFKTLTMTDSDLRGSGTLDVFEDIALSGGRIVPSGALRVPGNLTATDTILAVTAGQTRLDADKGLDISAMGAEVAIPNGRNPAFFNETILTAGEGVTNKFASKTFNERYLLFDFDLDYTPTNVAAVSKARVSGTVSSTPNYGGMRGVRAGYNGMKNAVSQRTQQLRRNLVATDHAIPNEAFLLSNTNSPAGAYGPGDNNTIFGMHFWAQQYSGQGTQDRMGLSEGFDLNYYGTTFGLDRLFGEALVVGANYTYARSAISTDRGDNNDTETYWLSLYSEWISERGFFVNGMASAGWTDYKLQRIAENYVGFGKYNGRSYGASVDVGNYFKHEDFALAPYIGLHYLQVNSDTYTEKETFGNELVVGATENTSFESALGVKGRHRLDTRYGRFQTVGYVEWRYDFVNDDFDNSLTDPAVAIKSENVSASESMLNTGIGIGWTCTDYMEIGLGYDGRFNDQYEEHTGSMNLTVMF